jgi:hypothetical protein
VISLFVVVPVGLFVLECHLRDLQIYFVCCYLKIWIKIQKCCILVVEYAKYIAIIVDDRYEYSTVQVHVIIHTCQCVQSIG